MKYPVGIQNFEKIRKEDYVYVDKTALIWQLVNSGCYYFLSRPRRFGKSLLLSTIAAWFQGKKELFDGLAIMELASECPEAHPVLRLDLGGQTYSRPEELPEVLNNYLSAWEKLYGTDPTEHSPARRFWGIIHRACEQTGRQVVILIDEYDKPLLEAIDNEPLCEEYRSILRGVYGNLKTCDACIKFAMLTGVTKFSKLSIFSDLNNLNDISMIPQYATLCGITEQELETYFAPGIEELAQCGGISLAEARKQLKRRYDGYLFEEHAERVYNPFSLLSALNNRKFMDYWFGTGTPTFLVKLMVRENVVLENLGDVPVRPSKLNTLEAIPCPFSTKAATSPSTTLTIWTITTCVFPMKKWNAPFCRNCCHVIPAGTTARRCCAIWSGPSAWENPNLFCASWKPCWRIFHMNTAR